jgi:hypothetical protein
MHFLKLILTKILVPLHITHELLKIANFAKN